MSIIFDSIKTRNLDQVYEINLNQYYQQYLSDHVDNSEVEDGDFSVRVASGINHPDFNAVVQIDITDNFDTVFPDVKSFFDRKSLSYTWFIIPSTEPQDLVTNLKQNRLRYVGDDVIVGVELDGMVRNISAPNSLYIEAINSQDMLGTWVDLYTKSRNIKGEQVEQLKQVYRGVDFEDPNLPYIKYIGWLNGEPVACSTLVTAGGIAVVYDETLLPKYKGFGIEDAINITPLKKAREMGYLVGLIPTSVGNMKRFTGLGFTELFKVKKFVHLSGTGRRRRRKL